MLPALLYYDFHTCGIEQKFLASVLKLPTIASITPVVIAVSEETKWTFVRVEASDGLSGVGEASLSGQESAMAEIAGKYGQHLTGMPMAVIEKIAVADWMDRAYCAVVSALEQASWDIRGKRAGAPVHALLGGARNEAIPVYANINRRTRDRSPEGFVASAKDALAAGHKSLKIAPFDDLQPDMGAEGDALFRQGIDRVAAVCAAAGPDVQVLVDCHWRLNVTRARDFLREAAALGLYWVECPLPEDPDDCADLARLRPLKDDLGVRMAGAEQGTNIAYFEKFIAAGVYDVIMPDVKYCGGIGTMLRLAEIAAEKGIGFSPHNPTGPLCHLASLHIAAVIPNLLVLEHQFDESPMFTELCPGAVPEMRDGLSSLPVGNGLGFSLPG